MAKNTSSEEQLEKHLEYIRRSELFDREFYSQSNNDLKDMDPAVHYLQYGGFEGRDPSPRFSSATYLTENLDVAACTMNPLLHYELFGRKEGRSLARADRSQNTRDNTSDVCREIHPQDFIYKFIENNPAVDPLNYYITDGALSASKLRTLIDKETNLASSAPFSLLEFASGYGCVTRHLKKVLPLAEVVSCDIHTEAMVFISTKLCTEVQLSVTYPSDFDLQRQFDCVFALSFFTHVPKAMFGSWMQALFKHVAPGGSLIFTTSGDISAKKIWSDNIPLDADGFWFTPESEQHDLDVANYGTAVSSPGFVTRLIYKELGPQLAVLETGFWWGHQDVYVLNKLN
jgi:hypothetical protein